jgi:hypothetical protein
MQPLLLGNAYHELTANEIDLFPDKAFVNERNIRLNIWGVPEGIRPYDANWCSSNLFSSGFRNGRTAFTNVSRGRVTMTTV